MLLGFFSRCLSSQRLPCGDVTIPKRREGRKTERNEGEKERLGCERNDKRAARIQDIAVGSKAVRKVATKRHPHIYLSIPKLSHLSSSIICKRGEERKKERVIEIIREKSMKKEERKRGEWVIGR